MKQITLILIALMLMACASSENKYKSSEDIMREVAQVEIEKGWIKSDDGQPLEVIIASSPSHGLLGDQLARLSEGSSAKSLAELLLRLKNNPNSDVLLYVTNPSAGKDYRLIEQALEGLQLEGVKFFLAARADYKEKFENLIKPSGADFVFIDTINKKL